MWKRASDSYFSPDEFRIAVQPCIQALRSVTWILQSNKAKIQAFDDWYLPWQQKLKDDVVLRWAVQARNRIEKQGDLQTHSKLKVTFSRSWHDKASLECDLPPMMTTDRIAETALNQAPHGQDEEAVLKIERRWVDLGLPDYEVLDALSRTYAVLHELVTDAHRHLTPSVRPSDCPANVSEAPGLLECMADINKPRIIWVKLRDRQQAVVTPFFRETSSEDLDAAGKRYGIVQPAIDRLKQAKSFQEECEGWFEVAKGMLRVDKYHRPTALLRTDKTMHIIALEMHDRAEKHIALRHLAQQARRLGARAVFLINEVWRRPAEKISEEPYAVDMQTRYEALVLHGLKDDGTFLNCTAGFRRIGEAIVFEPEQVDFKDFPNILRPLCDIWRIRSPHGPSAGTS
jgi:hypothetical protein